MRRLMAQQWVTVDYIAADEDGGLSFVSGDPLDDHPVFKATVMWFIDSVDTLILGANAYAQLGAAQEALDRIQRRVHAGGHAGRR